MSTFRTSRWLTHGWTLQELIAPSETVIFDKDWDWSGTRVMLSKEIASITGINLKELEMISYELDKIPVAIRMSWAASRETIREEDMAYCLMGIFDINMPMFYGEGQKAFRRLQEEIIKQSTDMSIFAWTDSPAMAESPSQCTDFRGILAPSPRSSSSQGLGSSKQGCMTT